MSSLNGLAVTVRIEQITCSQSLKWTKLKFVNKCTYVSKGSIENLNIPDEWLYHSKLKFRVYEPLLIENTLDDIRSKFQKSQKFQKFQKLVGEHHLHGKAIGCGSIRLNFLEPDQKIERVIDLKAKGSQEIIGRIQISMHTSRTQLQPHSNKYSMLGLLAENKIKKSLERRSKKLICYTKNRKNIPAYMIIEDKPKKSIIICIRGTLSISDILIDLKAYNVDYNCEDYYHCGMHQSANIIFNELRDKIKKYNNYSVKVTGHSLGAAVSSIVAILLQKHEFDTQAWNFATPPCCSFSLTSRTKDFINNFVNENDIITRMSFENLREISKMNLNKNELESTNRKLYIPGKIYYLHKKDGESELKCGESQPDHLTGISPQHDILNHVVWEYKKNLKTIIQYVK
ncbi:alpha/beta-hydrolase [Rhizophagus irregularis]|uniref:Alpha/beta-hydrolase n=1 Tax=Rhizophagus irregularis TaxID=588596 RepID=A0A2I1GRN9_9GLOM|nr:alpha/beta-hydrolase [Rhizophagus irregularis]